MGAVTRIRPSRGPLGSARDGRRPARSRRYVPSHKPALHVLLGKTIEFLLSAGESPENVALELVGQAARVNSREPSLRAKNAQHVQQAQERFADVCGVVHDWHRESAYTNSDGDPLQLTQRSLRTLVGKRVSREKIGRTVRWMHENGVIRKTRRGKIALVGGRTVVFSQDGRRAIVLNRAAALVPQYLRTALRNADTQDLVSRDIDRDARVFFLPEKYVPLWREIARERARAFLEGVDSWLEDHACRDEIGPVREVAVHCYAYTGDSRSPNAAGTKIRRLKVGTQ